MLALQDFATHDIIQSLLGRSRSPPGAGTGIDCRKRWGSVSTICGSRSG